MKKILIFISLFLLVGCNKIEQANCNIDLKNEYEGYTLKANYKIYYDKYEYVTKIEEDITYESNIDSVIDYYYKSKDIEYKNLTRFGGIDYSIEKGNDKVMITATRDLNNTDVKEMIKEKIIDIDYTHANKLTLYGMKDYYESKGAVCDIE